ncbi:unnamed protein product, partial [Closterium sp. Naga37s-1]
PPLPRPQAPNPTPGCAVTCLATRFIPVESMRAIGVESVGISTAWVSQAGLSSHRAVLDTDACPPDQSASALTTKALCRPFHMPCLVYTVQQPAASITLIQSASLFLSFSLWSPLPLFTQCGGDTPLISLPLDFTAPSSHYPMIPPPHHPFNPSPIIPSSPHHALALALGSRSDG